jgi:hypothetical protein
VIFIAAILLDLTHMHSQRRPLQWRAAHSKRAAYCRCDPNAGGQLGLRDYHVALWGRVLFLQRGPRKSKGLLWPSEPMGPICCANAQQDHFGIYYGTLLSSALLTDIISDLHIYLFIFQALSADATIFFGPRSPGNKDPLATEPPVRPIMANDDNTILGFFKDIGSIGVLVIDEVHIVRTRKSIYNALLRLSRLSSLVLGLSATPIYTHPKVCKEQS